MEIVFSPKYVVDACVILAYQDPEEEHHEEALNFFKALDKFAKEGKEAEIIVPAHLYLEVNLNIGKKKEEAKAGKRKIFEPRQMQERFKWTGYPVSLELMKNIEDKGLYEKFGIKLRVGDFIYASIAYIESLPLVTLDKKDFSKVASDINVIFINN